MESLLREDISTTTFSCLNSTNFHNNSYLSIPLENFSTAIQNNFVPPLDDELSRLRINSFINSNLLIPLQQASDLVVEQLANIALSEKYDEITGLAFGENYDRNISNSIRQNFAQRNYSQLPQIQVIPSNDLAGATGAYNSERNTIFLSDELVNNQNSQQIAGVLLEEIGHYIDSQINVIDFVGDEGDVFSRIVSGQNLDASELELLRQEDDHGLINFNNQLIAVEFKNIKGNNSGNILKGTNKTDRILGLGGHDKLSGLAGNDTLDGGANNDTMIGGLGNDYYFVSQTGDFAQEVAKQGTDTVSTSLSYNLPDNFENLILTGVKSIEGTGNQLPNVLTGNKFNNVLKGLEGKDKLSGLAGDDTLDGGTDKDTMIGGIGNDYYFVSEIGDFVQEVAKQGTDTVSTSLSYNLPDNFENLILTGIEANSGTGNQDTNILTGSVADNTLTGLGGNDKLLGSDGHDYLDGGAGNDYLDGGAGNNTLFGYGATNNEVDTLVGSSGADTFLLSNSSSVYYDKSDNLDYAIIKGFDISTDKIELKPLSNEIADSNKAFGYQLVTNNANTELRLGSNNELIGVIQGITNLSLDGSYFSWIGDKLGDDTPGSIINSATPKELADSLWDAGSTMAEIGAELKKRGFDLPTIADAVKHGITKSDGANVSDNDLAEALWKSGYDIDGKKLADLLLKEEVSITAITQTLKSLGLPAETVADAIISISEDKTPRKIAGYLSELGSTTVQIGAELKNRGFDLPTIADAIKGGIIKTDGSSVSENDLAEALWKSGYEIDARKLADLLWDEGVDAVKIAQALKYVGVPLENIADAFNEGITKADGSSLRYTKGDGVNTADIDTGFVNVAEPLWKSGYDIDGKKLADLLWDEGATAEQIGLAFNYLGFSLEDLASSVAQGITKSDGTAVDITEVTKALWKSGYEIDTKKLAQLLSKTGASNTTIAKEIYSLDFKLDGVTDALVDGVYANSSTNDFYSPVALALSELMGSLGDDSIPGKIADLLSKEGANTTEISQALKSLGLPVETIANTIINIGEDPTNPRIIAGSLSNLGLTTIQIGVELKNRGFDLPKIADAIKREVKKTDGSSVSENDLAEALWKSGYEIDARKLADLLWDEGVDTVKIAQALKYVGVPLENIADAFNEGITKADGSSLRYIKGDGIKTTDIDTGFINVAEPLWKSGYEIDVKKLADLLWDEGATAEQIGQAFNYLGLSVEDIANGVAQGITKSDGTTVSISDVTKAIGNSGYEINTRQLAQLLSKAGTNDTTIAKEIYSLGFKLENITDALADGLYANSAGNIYASVAIALSKLTDATGALLVKPGKLADLLWDEGATAEQIGSAMYNSGFSLAQTTDAVESGITKTDGSNVSYGTLAKALWIQEFQGNGLLTQRKLGELLWNKKANKEELLGLGKVKYIGQALKSVGFTLEDIADVVKWGVPQPTISNSSSYKPAQSFSQWYKTTTQKIKEINSFPNYTDTATALWNSGHKIDTRKLADLLWDEGAIPEEIGQAFFNLNFTPQQTADALKYGVTKSDGKNLGYLEVAQSLWYNAGYKGTYGLNSQKLADLLWDNGASQGDIGSAFYTLGFTPQDTATAIKFGVTKSDGSKLNYTDVAKALWIRPFYDKYGLGSRKLADLLWDNGASQEDMGQAMRELNFGLPTIADAVKWGVTNSSGKNLDYVDVGIALWKSGYSIDGTKMADLLRNISANEVNIGQSLKYLGFSNESIGYSMQKAGFSASQMGRALWNSGNAISNDRVAIIIYSLDGSYNDVVSALKGTGDISNSLNAETIALKQWVKQKIINPAYEEVKKNAPAIANIVDTASNIVNKAADGKIGQAWDAAVDAAKEVANTVDVGVIVDVLRKIPVVGTAVGVIGGLISAVSGNDKGVVKEAINAALGYFGGSNIITPKMVDFAIDILWELKDKDYQGAISETLKDLGMEETVSKLFVDVSWSMANDGDWKTLIGSALKAVGLKNADALTKIAGNIIDKNYKDAIKGGLELVGFSNLGIDQAKANLFVDTAWSMASSGDWKTLINTALNLAGVPKADALGKIASNMIDKNYKDAIKATIDLVGVSNLGIDQTKANLFVDTAWSMASSGDWKSLINMALKAVNVKDADALSKIASDIVDKNYKGAVKGGIELIGLKNLGIDQAKADLLIELASSITSSGDWKSLINIALKQGNLKDADALSKIAGNIVDKNYKEAIKGSIQLVGLKNLGIDQAKADAVLALTTAIQDGNTNQVADTLIALSGNKPEIINSTWVKELKDTNLSNDQQALETGLSKLGFSNAKQWTNTIWAVKDGKYLDAVSGILTLGKFTDGQDWLKIIDNLQKNDPQGVEALLSKLGFSNAKQWTNTIWAVKDGKYFDALSTVFAMGKYTDGQDWLKIVDNLQKNDPQGVETLLSKLGFSDAKQWTNTIWAVKDGKYLDAVSGILTLGKFTDGQDWLKIIDNLQKNDPKGVEALLSKLGFSNAKQWTNTIWAVKDGKYLDALSDVFALGNFTEGQDWSKIINNLQQGKYLEGLSTAFKLAGFPDGESLADAALAVKKGNYMEAFGEALNLIDGGEDLAAAFKNLVNGNYQEFINSMIKAVPFIAKFFA